MEQALRKLKSELENHRLVKKVEYNYYYFTITWTSGIKERLITKRFENSHEFRKLKYLRSKIRPNFMPYAEWWEDISSGIPIKPEYLEGAEFEENPDDYVNLVNWKWSEYDNNKFYERLILVHEIIEYITKHGWTGQKYPENTIRESFQSIYKESLIPYKFKFKRGFRIRNYKGIERPGEKLIKHFMPCEYYGFNHANYLFSIKTPTDAKRLYLAIMNVIRNNYRLRKKGYKKLKDINYSTILKNMRDQRRKKKIKPYKMKHIGLYRSIIKDLELNGMSYYDVDPLMGECYLAALAEECPYYYRKTVPFDFYSKNMTDFLGTENNYHSNNHRCDFSIYDNNFIFNYELFDESFKNMQENSDLTIIYVNNENSELWHKNHPKPHDKIEMKNCKYPLKNGYYYIYY